MQLAIGLALAACGSRGPELVAADAQGPELEAEVGFEELEPLSFELGGGSYESAPARFFYRFSPALDTSARTPLCVLFNGGPGIGSGLLDEQLGAKLYNGDDNPHSLTEWCHMLSVDARATGFSYLLKEGSGLSDFNAYVDAADFLRLVLRWVERHGLYDTPVVLVGSSFGGARATVMLDMLWKLPEYEAGQRPFYSPALLEEWEHQAQARGLSGARKLAGYFRHQVLIQPSIASDLQHRLMAELMAEPGSIVQQLAAEYETQFVPCAPDTDCDPYSNVISFVNSLDKSPYDYRAPASWLTDLLAGRKQRVADIDGLTARWGREVESIPGLLPAEREGAWRLTGTDSSPSDVESWVERFGELGQNDRYFLSLNVQVTQAFDSPSVREAGGWWRSDEIGHMFVSNLENVQSFITRASFDLVGYSPALSLALESYPEVGRVELVSEPAAAERPGTWVLYDEAGEQIATIRAPPYAAAHSVGLSHASELAGDVRDWWSKVKPR